MTQPPPDAALLGDPALITCIDHVGIAVPDLDAAIAWYRDTLGLELTHQEVNEEQGVREAMIGTGNAQIQLLAPLTPESTIAKFLDRSGPGLQQLAYRCRRHCGTKGCGCSTTHLAVARPTPG